MTKPLKNKEREIGEMKSGMKKSEVVAQFLRLAGAAQRILDLAYEEVHSQDLLTNDLLHKLELGSAKDRNKVATQIAKCRKERRYYKDQVEEVEALINWMEENKDAFNKLKQVLGKMRKAEEWHESRTYVPRVLPAEEFDWQDKVFLGEEA